jgi:hypothetical protein
MKCSKEECLNEISATSLATLCGQVVGSVRGWVPANLPQETVRHLLAHPDDPEWTGLRLFPPSEGSPEGTPPRIMVFMVACQCGMMGIGRLR